MSAIRFSASLDYNGIFLSLTGIEPAPVGEHMKLMLIPNSWTLNVMKKVAIGHFCKKVIWIGIKRNIPVNYRIPVHIVEIGTSLYIPWPSMKKRRTYKLRYF